MSTEDVLSRNELSEMDSDLPAESEVRHDSDDVLRQWLELAAAGQRTANGTVRKFVETVDRVAPLDRVGLTKRREVITAALEMTQRLVHAPYDVGRSLVQSAVLVNVGVDVDVDIASHQSTNQV